MGFAVPAGKGCTHSDKSKRFVRQELNGGEWQERVLEQGFYPAFKSQPGRYKEGNNASAVKDMEAVWEVKEWKQQGATMQLQEPAWCTSPLSVAGKWDTQAGKISADMSIYIRSNTQSRWMIYRQQKEPDNRTTVFDLENQFFHVKLAPEAYKFFGFAIPEKEGTERYYCFKVMVYGFVSG